MRKEKCSVVIVSVLLALSIVTLVGCGESDDSSSPDSGGNATQEYTGPLASDYGIQNANNAALVLVDESEDYVIKAAAFMTDADGEVHVLGAIPDNQTKVFEITPGVSTLSITYFARSSGSYVYWECEREIVRHFTAVASRAYKYTLKGGEECGAMYSPPTF